MRKHPRRLRRAFGAAHGGAAVLCGGYAAAKAPGARTNGRVTGIKARSSPDANGVLRRMRAGLARCPKDNGRSRAPGRAPKALGDRGSILRIEPRTGASK